MEYVKISDTRAMFKMNNLINFLGLEKAENFIYTYRRAIKPLGDEFSMKTCNLGELVARYKSGDI